MKRPDIKQYDNLYYDPSIGNGFIDDIQKYADWQEQQIKELKVSNKCFKKVLIRNGYIKQETE